MVNSVKDLALMGGSRIRARFFGLRLQNDNHMKIVCITPVFPPIRAGMARAAFEIAAALGERAEVEVWTSVSPPAMRGEMERGFLTNSPHPSPY